MTAPTAAIAPLITPRAVPTAFIKPINLAIIKRTGPIAATTSANIIIAFLGPSPKSLNLLINLVKPSIKLWNCPPTTLPIEAPSSDKAFLNLWIEACNSSYLTLASSLKAEFSFQAVFALSIADDRVSCPPASLDNTSTS